MYKKKLTERKRMRQPLQKIDDDTNKLIDLFKDFLHSNGIRTTRERAWIILQKAHRLPFEYLIEKNTDGIAYQGAGQHISSKHGNQLMVVKELGRFEVKAVSDRKSRNRKATIRYKLPNDLLTEIQERIPVEECID